jgi:hypothetical protein
VVLVWRIEDIGATKVVRELRTALIGRKSSFALSQFAVEVAKLYASELCEKAHSV